MTDGERSIFTLGSNDGEASIATSVSERHKNNEQVRKRARVNDQSLDPISGSLMCRLDKSQCHLPRSNLMELKKRSFRCALHRWIHRRFEQKDMVIICTTCNIPLCINCYKPFHAVANVQELHHIVESIISNNLQHRVANINS